MVRKKTPKRSGKKAKKEVPKVEAPVAPPKKAKPPKRASWRPSAYNVQTESGTPLNVEQEGKRTIFFTGPAVWNVPQDRDEEAILEDLLEHSGNGYTMRKLPLVRQRKDGYWLPDKEAIKAALEEGTSEEE
jgi:hypothetical protein